MPGYLRSKCEQCGFLSEPFPESYLTLRLDEPLKLKSSKPHPEYDSELILPHSGERSAIQTHGFNYRTATGEGRLIKYTRYYCRDCGEPFEQKKYFISGIRYIGCFWPMAGSVAIGVIIWLLTDKWPIGLLAFGLVLVLTSYLLGAFVEGKLKKKLSEKISETRDLPRCPKCAGIETTRQRLKCPKCGLRSAKLVASTKSKKS